MKKGAHLTIIKPDFEAKQWLVFTGTIVETPFLPVCRSQIAVEVSGVLEKLLLSMRGFHSMIAYGDYLKEIAYASKKVDIEAKQLT